MSETTVNVAVRFSAADATVSDSAAVCPEMVATEYRCSSPGHIPESMVFVVTSDEADRSIFAGEVVAAHVSDDHPEKITNPGRSWGDGTGRFRIVSELLAGSLEDVPNV